MAAAAPAFLHRHPLRLPMRFKLPRPLPFLTFPDLSPSLAQPCYGFLRITSIPQCLKHEHPGKVSIGPLNGSYSAQQTDHDGTDPETVEWVINAVHDPMVEVDPVTVNNQMLAQKQSRRLQESTSVAEVSLPTVSQSTKRLSSTTIATATALILLIVAITPLFLRFRERFERLQRRMDASLTTRTSEPSKAKREVVKGTTKASRDAIPVTAIKKAEVVALGTLPSSNGQNHKNLHAHENAITKQRPYYKGSVVHSEGHNVTYQLLTNNEIQQKTHNITTKLSLEEEVPKISESKDFTDNAPSKGHDEEVDAMGGQRLKRLMDQSLSLSQVGHADSGVVLEESSFQTLVKAGQSYSGKHTPDSIQERKQVITEKAPVRLALKDSIACISSSSGLHSAANSSTETFAHSISCSSDFQTSTKSSIQTELSIASKSEMSAPESLEKETKKISKNDRKDFNKALEAVLPAVAIGVGTLGTLVGAGGALQVIGFAAAASLVSRDLIWAQSREALWQELSSITDRQKLLDFLMKRNIVKKIN